jgi:WD40 repeat protein
MRMRVGFWVIAAGIAVAFAGAGAAAEERGKAEIVPQLGHLGEVNSVALSPDGKTALSGSFDATLMLWDLASGREIREFVGHAGSVSSVAIMPDGKTALSGGSDATLRLWDLASGREIGKLEGHAGPVSSVAIAPDGKTALSGGGSYGSPGEFKLWDLATGREIRKLEGHTGSVSSVAFLPDGKTALSGSVDHTLRLWNLASGREIRKFEGHSSLVSTVAIAPDGKTALSSGLDSTLRLWDLVRGREIGKFEGYESRIPIAFAPDGETVLLGGWKTLRLRDFPRLREIRSFEGHPGYVHAIAIARDGKTALSGGDDKTLRLWDLASGREIRKFEGHTGEVNAVAFSPDGKTALSGTPGNTLRIWDLASGRQIRKFEGPVRKVSSLAIAPDGKTVLSGGGFEGKTLTLWDLASGREIGKLEGHEDTLNSVAIAPDGKTALSAGCDSLAFAKCLGGSLRLWDLANGREIRRYAGDAWPVSPGQVPYLATGPLGLGGGRPDDGTLRFWFSASEREFENTFGQPDGVNAVAIAPDGRTALLGGWKTLRLWDLEGSREINKFMARSRITAVAFSPDGKTALSGSSGAMLTLWDLASGREIKEFKAKTHPRTVTSVAFSPDGKTALSGSSDGSIDLWDLRGGEALVSLSASQDGNQLAITPKGFFTASQRDTDALAIVRGFEVASIGQVYQSLFNPDLVREALAGDPDGEVKRGSEVINLEKVLDAGPPPAAEIASREPGSHSNNGIVTVAARVTDRGKGIGRIEWRNNGVTAGVINAPAGQGADYEVSQQLALDPGENRIEVIAYEGRNLLAARPATTTINYTAPNFLEAVWQRVTGSAANSKPKLYILAIGINKYVDQGGESVRTTGATSHNYKADAAWRALEKGQILHRSCLHGRMRVSTSSALGRLTH